MNETIREKHLTPSKEKPLAPLPTPSPVTHQAGPSPREAGGEHGVAAADGRVVLQEDGAALPAHHVLHAGQQAERLWGSRGH